MYIRNEFCKGHVSNGGGDICWKSLEEREIWAGIDWKSFWKTEFRLGLRQWWWIGKGEREGKKVLIVGTEWSKFWLRTVW